jgi:5-methylcytosine-specific restriction protein A
LHLQTIVDANLKLTHASKTSTFEPISATGEMSILNNSLLLRQLISLNTFSMEKRVDSIVFRRMTYADFRHINKVGGEEEGGGGQSYIDFPTANISVQRWFDFLGQNTDVGAGNRPKWDFTINSLGLQAPIQLKISHRREQSVSITSQKIHSRDSNRIPSWNPANGFPVDYDPGTEYLVVYLVKTSDEQYWAGWFLQNQIPANWVGNPQLNKMFTDAAGYLKFRRPLFIETANRAWSFHFIARTVPNQIPTNEDIDTELELEDTSPRLQELFETNNHPEIVNRAIQIRQRNNKLVRNLKALYEGRCQITGEQFTFQKANGDWYSEVHHLIPLGENGSDSYANAIVVSPLIHRMLHYANVSEINLNNIVGGQLPIVINGNHYTITWHPEHIATVEHALND